MSATPDFENRYRKAMLRLGEPDRVPLGDVSIDITHKQKFLGRPLRTLEDEVEFWVKAGFDFAVAEVGLQTTSAIQDTKVSLEAQYALFDYDETEREWVQQDMSQIHTEADFEAFPWPDPNDLDYSKFEELSRIIPPGMKIMGALGKIFNSVWWMMGFQHFAECLIENPSLIQRMSEKVALLQLGVLDRMLEFDAVGAITHADDIAYSEALMVGPEHLRQYTFPWFKELVDRIHAKDKVAVFHSDGKLDQVMPDLIACGFDAIHPFEPKAMDIVAHKRMYGDQIGIIGNIDLGYTLTRGTPEEVAAECRQRISELGPGGGYALASSNSIPEYVPYENFLTLLDAVDEYGQYPLAVSEASPPPVTVTDPSPEMPAEEIGSAPALEIEDSLLKALTEAVIGGSSEDAREVTENAIADNITPQHIFTNALVPAMTEVGRLMETDEYFIPQVLLSAKAMNASVAILKPLMVQATETVEETGTVVVGTVLRDMHDIGKNLLVMMLEGRGLRVIDLGINVPPQKFVEAVQENQANVVAMSAMLTTTMMNMKAVIDALTEAGLRDRVKVIVGGAPIEDRFAEEIGADGFALNAAAGANLAHRMVAG